MDWLSGLLGVGGSLISGLFGQSAADEASDTAKEINRLQMDMAREFRTDDIRVNRENATSAYLRQQASDRTAFLRSEKAARDAFTRSLGADATRVQRLVKDARQAGIHPLAALGANLNAPIAQAVGASSGGVPVAAGTNVGPPQLSQPPYVGSPMGDAIASAVSSLGNMFQTDRQKLENELLRRQIKQVDLENAAMVANATSRTIIGGMRAAAIGGTRGAGGSPTGTISIDVDPRPRAYVDPTGRKVNVGAGSPAQVGENEYGEFADIDAAFRYLRDAVFKTEIAPNIGPAADALGIAWDVVKNRMSKRLLSPPSPAYAARRRSSPARGRQPGV